MPGEGPADDEPERGDPRRGVCMGDAEGEMGANVCLTWNEVSNDGDECERVRLVDALLQAEAPRELQRLPEL